MWWETRDCSIRRMNISSQTQSSRLLRSSTILRRVGSAERFEDVDDVFHGHWMIPWAHRQPPQAGKVLP